MPGLALTGVLEGRAQVTSTGIPALLRRGAVAVAAGRVALGLTALAWPSVPARPWGGAAAVRCPGGGGQPVLVERAAAGNAVAGRRIRRRRGPGRRRRGAYAGVMA